MIHFFRKLRKKLADDNKPLKYMRYAIGEILLVMVGILLAVQVNDWNESRKDKIEEISILNELKRGLSIDAFTVEFNFTQHERAQTSCEIILKFLEGDIEYNDSLNRHFAAVHYYTNFSSARGAYESIKTKGFESISNSKLRFKIINLYDRWYGILTKNQDILLDDILVIKRDFNPIHFDKFWIFNTEPMIYAGEMKPNNFLELKQNKEYKYHIKSLHSSHSSFITLNKSTFSKIESLIMSCQYEIQHLE